MKSSKIIYRLGVPTVLGLGIVTLALTAHGASRPSPTQDTNTDHSMSTTSQVSVNGEKISVPKTGTLHYTARDGTDITTTSNSAGMDVGTSNQNNPGNTSDISSDQSIGFDVSASSSTINMSEHGTHISSTIRSTSHSSSKINSKSSNSTNINITTH